MDKTEEISGVYKITNIINNKVYIGSAINIRIRKNSHKYMMLNNCHHSEHLKNAVNLYGYENFIFEVIEIVKDINELIDREQFYIDEYKSYDSKYGYNICPKAKNKLGVKHSEESKLKISKARKGKKYNFPPHIRKILSDAHKGEKNGRYGIEVSIDTRKKISESQKIRLKKIKNEFGYCISYSKLTEDDVKNIKRFLFFKAKQNKIAQYFNIGVTTISSIKNNKRWTHIMEYKNEFLWNPVYKIIMDIKYHYFNKFGNFGNYNLKEWLQKLNKEEYNNIFKCLQINQYNYEILIRYGIADMQQSMWTDKNSIYRECRSIVIDIKYDNIIVAPFRKFFNLEESEVEENKLANIQKELANAKIVEYSDKKDGSMQSARWYNGEIKMYGSMALKSEDSWRLADGYSRLTDNHKQFIQEHKEYTIIFEYISLADAHVVKYKKEDEGLYLIGMRNVYTGQELTYAQLMELARTWNIPVITIENTTLEQILQDCRKFKSHEKEGWVINIDGHKIKLKCDSYVQLHRILDYLSSINVIIKSIADNTFDDLKSKVPDAYQQRVIDIANQVFLYIDNMKNHTEYYYNLAPKEDKKQFMIWIDNNVPTEFRKYVRNKYLGVELNFLKSHSNSYKKAKEIGINRN